ncbi:MAG: nuclear transport factor 2 family protein [Woeseiaceae bacterium]|nr:nuclear transport factor 2 family protein [Woeseiaceae bacterium]
MRRITKFILLAALAVPVLAAEPADLAAEVRAAVQAFNDAYANNAVEAYFDHYADGASLFFYGERHDVSAYHDEWAEMITAGGGVVKNELSDVRIQVLPGDAVAIASYFVDYALRTPDGEVAESKGFESEVWQKIDGEWKVVSLHYTVVADNS